MKEEVVVLIVEDDDGHARLIEKNLRRASINKAKKKGTGVICAKHPKGRSGK